MDAGISLFAYFYSLVAFLGDLLPVYVAEDAVLAHSGYPAGWVFLQGLEEEKFEVFWKLFVDFWGIIANSFDERVVVRCMEWTLTM